MCRLDVACLLNKGGSTYDHSCKKSSKVFARICEIDFWNKRVKNKRAINYALFIFPSFKHFAQT